MRRRRGELFAALAAIGFGSAYVATAFALRSFDPLPVATYRGLLAGIVVALMLAVSRRRAALHPAAAPSARPRRLIRAIHVALIAAFGGPVFLAAMNLAVAGVGATIASFVAGLYAILAALLAPVLLREPLRPTAIAGFLVALVGTALLAELDPGGPTIVGIGWGLVAAVSFALFLVLTRKWSGPDGLEPIVLVLVTQAATTVALGAVVLATDPGSLQPGGIVPEAVLGVAWLAFVSAAGQALAIVAVRLLSASRSSAFLLLNPIAAALLSLLLLSEQPTALQGLGGLLVLAGIAVVTIRRGAKPVS